MAIELEPFWQRLRGLEADSGSNVKAGAQAEAMKASAQARILKSQEALKAARLAQVGPSAFAAEQAGVMNAARAARAARATMGSGAVPAGAVPPVGATPAAGVVPTNSGGFGARAMQVARTPITLGGMARTAGGLMKSAVSLPALIPSGVSALASRMAGGDWGNVATAAVDPRLPVRAMAERYADLAPEFMGGLSPEAVAAGRSQGASDIGGDFAARMVPDLTGRAPTRVPPVTGSGFGAEVSPGMRSYGQESVVSSVPGPNMLRQAESTPGGGKMVKFRDPETGNWTYTDTTTPGGIPAGVQTTPIENRVSVIPTAPGGGYSGGPSYTPAAPGASPQGILSAMATPSALSQARQAAANRGDWAAVRDSYQQGGGTWQGTTAAQDSEARVMSELQDALRNAPNNSSAKIIQARLQSLEQGKAAAKRLEVESSIEREKQKATSAGQQGTLQLGYDRLIADLTDPARIKSKADADNTRLRTAAADEWLKTHQGDYPGAAAIAMGRQPQGATFSESAITAPKEGMVNLIQRTGPGAGRASSVPIQAQQETQTMAQARAWPGSAGKSDAQLREQAAKKNVRLVD